MKNKSRAQQGFTLLFAALIASIVLALGASIFDIALKQVALSSASRESQYAFYAADTAAECALYWDDRFNYFATTTPTLPAGQPDCDAQVLTVSGTHTAVNPATYPYTMSFQFTPNGYCANVTVTKSSSIGSNGQTIISTLIHADGYNTTCATISTSPIALQRSVQLNY